MIKDVITGLWRFDIYRHLFRPRMSWSLWICRGSGEFCFCI